MGPRIQQLEEAYARFLGCAHTLATSSCTASLHLAYLAAGVGPGDEGVVPSMSFAATSNAVLYCGGSPGFAEIVGTGDLGLDPAHVERRVPNRAEGGCTKDFGGGGTARWGGGGG